MKVIVDERETALYQCLLTLISQTQQSPPSIVLSKEVLPLGDIYFKTNDDKDILLIERKSFSDLVSSIKDGRYEEQSYRLLNSSGFAPHSVVYLVEGMFSQLRNPADKKIIYSAMTSLQYFKGFSTMRTSSVSESAEWILFMADKIDRDLAKGKIPNNLATLNTQNETSTSADYCSVVKKVKKDNITPENIGEIILCQIPGISSVTAITIMKKFNGFPHFIEELQKNPACIENISIENNGKIRKISKSCLENIRRFLTSSCTSTIELVD
jgi:ERCC4-type nuclease